MSFFNEFIKASKKAGSFADLLTKGEEEKALSPTPKQAAFSRDSDIQAPVVKPSVESTNPLSKYWGKIPVQYRPIAAIGGGLGALFLVKNLFKK